MGSLSSFVHPRPTSFLLHQEDIQHSTFCEFPRNEHSESPPFAESYTVRHSNITHKSSRACQVSFIAASPKYFGSIFTFIAAFSAPLIPDNGKSHNWKFANTIVHHQLDHGRDSGSEYQGVSFADVSWDGKLAVTESEAKSVSFFSFSFCRSNSISRAF